MNQWIPRPRFQDSGFFAWGGSASGGKFQGQKGITLIEVIISIGLIVTLFSGILFAYFSILMVTKNSSVREEALGILTREIEIVRGLPFDQVGTIGGIPSGILSQTKVVTSTAGNTFSVSATVRSIDDPFDGTISSNPADTAPADYKAVEFQITCTSCTTFVPVTITTTVAPKNLESSSATGSLFINAFDAAGNGVPGATVHVINASVTPAINLTDTTNQNGILQLVGVPTSTQGYHIDVTKSGYSLDRTYAPGAVGNPNPIVPDATVAQGTLTQISFLIDRVSTMRVQTKNMFCGTVAGQDFTLQGDKIIGINPDVLKFSTSSTTDAQGKRTFSDLELDTYTLGFGGASYDLMGTMPLTPIIVNPSSTVDFAFILTATTPHSLVVTVKDAVTSQGVASSTVTITKAGFSRTIITGRNTLLETDWSGNNYASQDGGLDADTVPGTLSMLAGINGYSTTTVSWLISRTYDAGSSTSKYFGLSWNPATQPGGTGPNSVTFQVATNNDNATWNFVGPDGTGSTYYASASTTMPVAHFGDRYLRYKIFMSTQDASFTPSVDDVSIEFSGACVPPAQAYFGGLSAGTYSIDVSADGYQSATSSVVVGAGANQVNVLLPP